MTPIGSTQASILAWLADHEHVMASEIANACGVMVVSIRGRLVFLKTQRLVSSKLNDAVPPVRIYAITAEGRRRIEL